MPQILDKPRPSTNADVLRFLLRAKQESDRRNWNAKYTYLQRAIKLDRDNFMVDLPAGRHWGVTHVPTGFRIHAPANLVGNLRRKAPPPPNSGQFELPAGDSALLSGDPGPEKSARAENCPLLAAFKAMVRMTSL